MGYLSRDQLELAMGHLERLMAARDLTQTKLSQLSSVSQSTISRVLGGDLAPTEDVLRKLFEGMGLRLEDVLELSAPSSDELIGYLATPLTGVVDDPKKDSVIQAFVEEVKAITANFKDPRFTIYWPGDYTHPVRHPEFASEKVYLIDRSRASSYDFIILLCAVPSYGVGQENEIATQAGLPGIRLIPQKISRMITGSFLDATNIEYSGSLEQEIKFDRDALEEALATVRLRYFRHRALYKDLNGQDFGSRLQRLINSRAGDNQIFANDLGVSLSYVLTLVGEPMTVSNPSARLLKRMASLLGVSVSYLLGETPELDSTLTESHASWNEWLRNRDGVNGSVAMAIWDTWNEDYLKKKREQTLVSRRDAVHAC